MHTKPPKWLKTLKAQGEAGPDTLRTARRILVAMLGTTVILIGIALLVLPGPAFIVIPLGLAILATEFVWAKRWLNKLKSMVKRTPSPGEKKSDA